MRGCAARALATGDSPSAPPGGFGNEKLLLRMAVPHSTQAAQHF